MLWNNVMYLQYVKFILLRRKEDDGFVVLVFNTDVGATFYQRPDGICMTKHSGEQQWWEVVHVACLNIGAPGGIIRRYTSAMGVYTYCYAFVFVF